MRYKQFPNWRKFEKSSQYIFVIAVFYRFLFVPYSFSLFKLLVRNSRFDFPKCVLHAKVSFSRSRQGAGKPVRAPADFLFMNHVLATASWPFRPAGEPRSPTWEKIAKFPGSRGSVDRTGDFRTSSDFRFPGTSFCEAFPASFHPFLPISPPRTFSHRPFSFLSPGPLARFIASGRSFRIVIRSLGPGEYDSYKWRRSWLKSFSLQLYWER